MGLNDTCCVVTERLMMGLVMMIERGFKRFNAVKERRDSGMVFVVKGV